MPVIFAVALVVHGVIHLLGFAKAFGLADLPQLTQPITPVAGVCWLCAAVLFFAAAIAMFAWPRAWWAIGAAAIVVSMAAIVPSWTDARFGAFANLIALVGVVFGFLAQGPFSLRSAYDRDAARGLASVAVADTLTERDVVHLPTPVQQYLRVTGAIGQPRVSNFHARMHGRIRAARNTRWMPLAAEQYNFITSPARLFYLSASMFGIPVQGYHRYAGASATMTIKAAALVPVVQACGREMDQGETVTMFNDMCVMAPATLVDRGITWESVDARTARAVFRNAGQTIRAELSFNEAGELTNFFSDDRYETSPDGTTMTRVRWSTPIGAYRAFGPVRLASKGEGRWHESEGEYAYIELAIDEVMYNVRGR